MTREQFNEFTAKVDSQLGNLRNEWEGPEPHDFRNMKGRGVRFVHSGLFVKLPDFGNSPFVAGADFAPDGQIHCKILVGDAAAAALICERIRGAGYEPRVVLRESSETMCEGESMGRSTPPYDQVLFEVPVPAR